MQQSLYNLELKANVKASAKNSDVKARVWHHLHWCTSETQLVYMVLMFVNLKSRLTSQMTNRTVFQQHVHNADINKSTDCTCNQFTTSTHLYQVSI